MQRNLRWALAGCALVAVGVSGACAAPLEPEGAGESSTALCTKTSLSGCLPPKRSCGNPPYVTPAWEKPADDRIAFGTLLEGAGYGADGNSDWVDITAGNFCNGPEKELAVIKNQTSQFSILRGPTPYAVGAFDFGTVTGADGQPWQAVAAADFDGDGFDELVAARYVPSGSNPNLVVMRVNPSTCAGPTVTASTKIPQPVNVAFLDVAVGTFDRSGKKIALLQSAKPHFRLATTNGASLTTGGGFELDSDDRYPWKKIATGDLDHDGIDELVAIREVKDGKGATVLVYKWNDGIGDFGRIATSTFGNTGNSNWTGLTLGDFDADGNAAIVLQKNEHSNFALLTYRPGSPLLNELDTSDLDSTAGQDWRGVTAIDWLGTDSGAAELIALRKAKNTSAGKYATDLFVYGNPFHRVRRESAILGQKAAWDQLRYGPGDPAPLPFRDGWLHPIAENVESAQGAHVTTINWLLASRTGYLTEVNGKPVLQGDYRALVDFLAKTQNTCVDGTQLRVSVTLAPKWVCNDPKATDFSTPEDTGMNELAEFSPATSDTSLSARRQRCSDTVAWARVIGKLAQTYHHLVSLGIDDFSGTFDGSSAGQYTPEEVAQVQSELRQRAGWLTFVPTTYYHGLRHAPRDFGQTVDTLLYYFRNEMIGPQCIEDPCGSSTVTNVIAEIDYAAAFLPPARKLQVGEYWAALDNSDISGRYEHASNAYDYTLTTIARNHYRVGGVTAYSVIAKSNQACSDASFLANDYCTLEYVYRAP